MGKKTIYFSDKMSDLGTRKYTDNPANVNSYVKQNARGIATCYILAPLYGLIRHNKAAFKKLITDDPKRNRVTVHLNYKGAPYDIEMDRSYIEDAKADFCDCSLDVALVVKALLLSGLAKPNEITDYYYEHSVPQGHKMHFSFATHNGGNPLDVMAAFGNMNPSSDLSFQKSLTEKAQTSINEISDDLLAKLDEWIKANDKVVTLSIFANTNHAVALTGVDREQKTITYYDQMTQQEHTMSLDHLLSKEKPSAAEPRLDQIICFDVDKHSCQTKGYETVGITSIRQALKNKAVQLDEKAVTDRLIQKFSNLFNEAWHDYARNNPAEMTSIVKDVLSSANLDWKKWNNKYALETMLDAGKNEAAYKKEYSDKQEIFKGIRKHLQENPETRKTPQDLGIIDAEKFDRLNNNFLAWEEPENKIPLRRSYDLYRDLYGIFKDFGLKDPNAENEDQQFPETTRTIKNFRSQLALIQEWKNSFSEAFAKDNTLSAEDFNETPEGKAIWNKYINSIEHNALSSDLNQKMIAATNDLSDHEAKWHAFQKEKETAALNSQRKQNADLAKQLAACTSNIELLTNNLNTTLQLSAQRMKTELTEVLNHAAGFLATESKKKSAESTERVYKALHTLAFLKESKLDENLPITNEDYKKYHSALNDLRRASLDYKNYKHDQSHRFGTAKKRYSSAKQLNAYLDTKQEIEPADLLQYTQLEKAKELQKKLTAQLHTGIQKLNEIKRSIDRKKVSLKDLENENQKNKAAYKKTAFDSNEASLHRPKPLSLD